MGIAECVLELLGGLRIQIMHDDGRFLRPVRPFGFGVGFLFCCSRILRLYVWGLTMVISSSTALPMALPNLSSRSRSSGLVWTCPFIRERKILFSSLRAWTYLASCRSVAEAMRASSGWIILVISVDCYSAIWSGVSHSLYRAKSLCERKKAHQIPGLRKAGFGHRKNCYGVPRFVI